MKAFISIDLEGMPYIVSPSHLSVGKPLYGEARKIATRVTLAVVEGLRGGGLEEIVIADSHGPMVNLLVEELPEGVELVRGYPRPVSMVRDVEGAELAIFLGYHSKAGTPRSTFDHTYTGSFAQVRVNGVAVSEFLLNAYVAGFYDVPVAMVAGDERLIEEDVKVATPWAEAVVLKKSYGRYSSRSPSLKTIERMLRDSTGRALKKLKEGRAKPLKVGEPVEVVVEFVSSAMAEACSLAPIFERIGGRSVRFIADNIVDAYKLLELASVISAGVRAITSTWR